MRSAQLLDTEQRERERLSRVLHDEVGQTLALIFRSKRFLRIARVDRRS
jgi:signal transduction histidine kinase